ncbi:AraC family transcriptional regulator [Pontibacter virosus]|uniref:Helix-turn-helix protein n=1 Tax=Pontibacter virosus TaxID=1765052 RepID=A0A2U1B0N1_9BACT|nr:response regulator transcription factor [Pontibacter virosus]PVY42203.1 helix-turn-helix protein [Pontibacter virosus]
MVDTDCEQLMTLYIKNMVCPRCIKVVRDELQAISLTVKEVVLGRAIIFRPENVSVEDIHKVLVRNGFDLIQDDQSKLVEQTKIIIINLFYKDNPEQNMSSISQYLSGVLKRDYTYISTTFKAMEKIPLSRYIILQKVERAKELLEYNEQNVSEISSLLGYKSVQHFSSQFKEVTGLNPLKYRNQQLYHRQPICAIQDLKETLSESE